MRLHASTLGNIVNHIKKDLYICWLITGMEPHTCLLIFAPRVTYCLLGISQDRIVIYRYIINNRSIWLEALRLAKAKILQLLKPRRSGVDPHKVCTILPPSGNDILERRFLGCIIICFGPIGYIQPMVEPTMLDNAIILPPFVYSPHRMALLRLLKGLPCLSL